MIEIITGGALSTVQDLGRFGVMKNGFTQSGVMDAHAMKLGNAILANDYNAPVIEMMLKGVMARFLTPELFCLTGGVCEAYLNDKPLEMNTSYKAETDDILTVKNVKSGMRSYLAVGGGFKVPSVMGSASTNLKIAVGGYEGRKLRTYDRIETGEASENAKAGKTVKEDKPKGEFTVLRAVPGPQDEMFTQEDKEIFFSETYTVTPAIDRMGIRLDGKPVKGKNGTDIISDGIVFGSVQIPNSGMPIILAADHQTTGGYAKIATVISVDLPLLAQARPGDKIRFSAVTVEEAEKLAIEEKQYFENISER
ncbi:MAG: biotin-dependent carboxyltransferase family protein [Clostridia bacterium]|nr:biotin-dependent carboxyltransferase family protein [Clostridia bacterium]